ncbi:MAG: hypothetical protein LH477_03025 [Nocardioides sp.]|nr:hypothetical protein [Nocardioides sp.]
MFAWRSPWRPPATPPELGRSATTLVAALDGVLLASLLQPARRRRTFVRTSVEQLLEVLETGAD